VSSHGRRKQNPEPAGPAQLGWALLVVAAALIGGLAAATLVHTSVTIAVIVSLVAGGIAVLAMFRSPARPPELNGDPDADPGRYATAPRRHPAPPAAYDPRSVPPGARDPRSVPPASFAPGAPDPVAPDPVAPDPVAPGPAARGPAGPDGQARGGTPGAHETVVQLLPLPSQPGGAGAAGAGPDAPWWDSAQGGPPAPSPGAKRAPAPDLSTYLASTFIAQCPRCGAFRLDIRRAGNGWNFRCESCEYTWTWQPGTPWPPVRVMPGERRESRPPAP